MAKYNIHFDITAVTESREGYHFAADYSFWVPLIDYFLVEADAFEIHCWEDELETIEEILQELDGATCRKEGKVFIVGGELDDKAKAFLRSRPFNEAGQLKWFSVFLDQGGLELFSSEHYGTEFVGYGLDIKQKKFFQSTLPKDVSVLEW